MDDLNRTKNRLAKTIEENMHFYRGELFSTLGITHFKEAPTDEQLPLLSSLVNDIEREFVKIDNHKWRLTTSYSGRSFTTRLHLVSPFQPDQPTLIFHPYVGSTTPMLSMRAFISNEFLEKFNVFYIVPANHENQYRFLTRFSRTFLDVELALVGSILTIDQAVKLSHELGSAKSVICGVSIGGVALSWYQKLFDGADLYFPIMAEPNLTRMIMKPYFASSIDQYEKRKLNRSYWEAFNIENGNFKLDRERIFPVLNLYDHYVEYEVGRQYWGGLQIKSFDVGHSSIVAVLPDLRSWLWEKCSSVVQSPAHI